MARLIRVARVLFLLALFALTGAPFSFPRDTTRTVTGITTLLASDRYVRANPSGGLGITLTLPTTPADGTPITITRVSANLDNVAIAGGGATIIDGTTTTIYLGGLGSSAQLQYVAASNRWDVLNLQRQLVVFRITSMNNGEYLQNPTVLVVGNVTWTGGAINSGQTQMLFGRGGTFVTGSMTCRTRVNVAANRTVVARLAAEGFGSAANLTNSLSMTIASGNALGTGVAQNVLAAPLTGTQGTLVAFAGTALPEAMDCQLETFTL